ncbi:MAG: MATE family efflux transporter [Clostridiales bacterium]|jgi:putative MATE family efflux protein|nr:MATE family efflux transporter [Clostridiales bacterium]
MVRDAKFYKTLVAIALPVALQSLISLGVNFLDNIMVGSLGEISISAVSVSNQLTVFVTFFIRGVAGGSAVLISQYWGKKDVARIKSIFGISLRISLAISVLIGGFAILFPHAALRVFTNDADIIAEGVRYIRIIGVTYIVFALSDTLIAMLRWVEVVRVALAVVSVSLFVNLFFNYALIYGHFGFPAIGVRGAAIATLLARCVELSIVLVYVFRIDRRLSLKASELVHFDRQLFVDFLRHGAPVMLGDVLWGLVGTVKGTLVGRMGVDMIAGVNMAETVMQLTFVFTTGLTGAACVIVGKSVGEKRYDLTRQYAGTIQILFALFGLVMSGFVLLLRAPALNLYNVSEPVRLLSYQFVTIGAISTVFGTYHASCFIGINRGAGDGRFVVKVDMIAGWGFTIPLTFLSFFVWHLPLPWVFFFSRFDQFFKWVPAFFRLRGDKWIRNVTRD